MKPGTLPEGTWGADHARMQVNADGASIEYDCAHGTLDAPLDLDDEGRLTVTGVHVRERPGPILLDEPPDSHPARYAGRVSGQTLSLTVTLTDTAEELGALLLTHGSEGRVWKCR